MQIIFKIFSLFLHNYSFPFSLGHNSSQFPIARESVPNREEVNPQWQESESPMARKRIRNGNESNPQVHRCMGAFMRLSAEVS